ncbi:hypothetical protein AB834_02270 [PVC group bacterium (ex Bugula neritina AB1)]|nr:hypothetical protein AB834_02270 [PVC group bacterium (ex Bugula neritina AB1)]
MKKNNPNKWPESYYSFQTLGRWLFIASLLLLFLILLVFFKDYNSEWRAYQKNFRDLESIETQEKLRQEVQELQKSTKYLKVKEDLERAEKSLAQKTDEIDTLQKEIKSAEDEHSRKLSAYQYKKADYDALKYAFEVKRAHHDELDDHQSKLDISETKIHKKFNKCRLEKEELYREVEKASTKLNALKQKLQDSQRALKDVQKEWRGVNSKKNILERKLKKVNLGSMDIWDKVGSSVRDLPILEMLNPYYKIDQIVVEDIRDDLHFTKVAKVDRCTSCHKGIVQKGYENAPQPYRTHPNLELYLGDNSPHSLKDFACTSCHGGRGRGTSFQSSAHTPNSAEQAKEWKEKYDWHPLHHWEQPMLPQKYIQSSCLKCHYSSVSLPGAEQLNLGLKLMEQAGCFVCHKIDKFEGYEHPGPNLSALASKLTNDKWTYHWIHDPKSLKSNPWMPSYFNQPNNNDSQSAMRSEQEVLAIKAFLYKESEEYVMKDIPVKGDPLKGKELVSSLGCYGCHNTLESQSSPRDLSFKGLAREHGPSLVHLGSKTNEKWLFNWLKDPVSYHSDSAMPNFRLSDQEAADIAAHLSSEVDQNLSRKEIPKTDETILNQITSDFLGKTNTENQTMEKLGNMSLEEKSLYTGEKLFLHYGCASCHEHEKFEHQNILPIGPELNGIASKPLSQLDFGHLHDIPHTRYDWLFRKIKNPRIFDHGKILNPLEKSIMPNYGFSDKEAEAIVTVLMGFVNRDAGVKIPEKTTKKETLEKGRKLIRRLNCTGCHLLENQGGALQPSIEDWLVTYQGKTSNDAKALSASFSPPNLIGEGKKVHSDWLFEFLHDPTPIRPWLTVRMPSYHLEESEWNTLVSYFSYLDDTGNLFSHKAVDPDTELYHKGKLLASPDYFDCGNCHIQGDKMPAGSPDRWAPNFSLAKKRLKPEWLKQWIYDPQSLLPGTKMPTYFDKEYFEYSGPDDVLGGDEHKQIKALVEYVIHSEDDKKYTAQSSKSDTTEKV